MLVSVAVSSAAGVAGGSSLIFEGSPGRELSDGDRGGTSTVEVVADLALSPRVAREVEPPRRGGRPRPRRVGFEIRSDDLG